MRRIIALAALAAAGAGLAPAVTAPASACDPNRFPNCMTYCQWVAWRYGELDERIENIMDPSLPPWPHIPVRGCP